MKHFFSLIMASILVTARANLMMGVRASRVGVGIISSSHGAQSQSLPSLHTRALSNTMAFVTSPSPLQRIYEQLPTTATSLPALASFGRCSKFHSSTMLMMGKRKKNGGAQNKKAKLKAMKKSKSEGDDDAIEPSLTNANLDDMLEDTEEESAPEFTATFASEYHAPVMPTECIDALLKQGEWGEMLSARKERWRKKRSIIEAKRRREEDAESDEEDVKGKGAELSSPTTSDVSVSQPRLFIDGTLGGGGHSQALLQQLSAGDVLIGCDVDPAALATASTRLMEYLGTCDYILDKNDNDPDEQPKCEWEKDRPMFIPVQSNFRNLVAVLSKVRHPTTGKLLLGDRGHTTADDTSNIANQHDDDGVQLEFPCGVNGMLLDLGVSSHQIDTSERGFAFMKEGPLDMRMSGTSQNSTLTAADICNEFDEATLIDILRTYGDEPRAKRLASAIVASRPLYSTTDLVHAINSVTPTFARQKRAGLIATSARVFQALRIVVNEEDGALKEVLEGVAPWALARSGSHYSLRRESADGDGEMEDGILAVLSYHSMEDKMAKRVIRDGKVDLLEKGGNRRRGGGALERDLYGNVIGGDTDTKVPFEPLTKPRKATDEEVEVNRRSRSATLRVAIRI
mmetsp:Transcript_197/g.494  ORF Transcript_197/g.494 Transcript_197/m.494 type:complete len:627 (+) Transcript_197:124-2004(+)